MIWPAVAIIAAMLLIVVGLGCLVLWPFREARDTAVDAQQWD